MNNEEYFMQEAIRLSMQNIDSGGGPFGAVIVKDGEIIATGVNRVTHDNDPTAHAEVNAIRIAAKVLNTFDLSDCEIYTSCEPCPMCLGAIYWAHIKKVYYANTKKDAQKINFDDSFIYDELQVPISERKIPFIRLLSEKAILTFEKWGKYDGKIRY